MVNEINGSNYVTVSRILLKRPILSSRVIQGQRQSAKKGRNRDRQIDIQIERDGDTDRKRVRQRQTD